jgi:hypothetical protein
MFRHRRQLRLWAARVLLAWVFAMGAGIANACLSTAAPGHAGLPAAPAAEATVEHHHATETPLTSPDMANCLDFCDKASVSIPTPKPAPADAQVHPLICLLGTSALPVPALEPVQGSVPRRDGVQAPPIPIVIAFLRLAL